MDPDPIGRGDYHPVGPEGSPTASGDETWGGTSLRGGAAVGGAGAAPRTPRSPPSAPGRPTRRSSLRPRRTGGRRGGRAGDVFPTPLCGRSPVSRMGRRSGIPFPGLIAFRCGVWSGRLRRGARVPSSPSCRPKEQFTQLLYERSGDSETLDQTTSTCVVWGRLSNVPRNLGRDLRIPGPLP